MSVGSQRPRDTGRREFLQAAGAGAALAVTPARSDGPTRPEAPTVGPTAPQQAWMDLGFGLFVHFGINTYYDVEWSDGTLDPANYDPTGLDTDQWCSAAAEAGMKYVVLVTKHHDGFCNWPTRETDYCVRSTPFRGDVVGEVFQSAKKYGLAVGLYYSLWDRHEPTHDADEAAYVDFMKRQLTELLTGYGPVVELWFDGMWKKQRTGWTKRIEGETSADSRSHRDEDFIDAWRSEGAYRWQMDHLYRFIKKMQPDCLVMNNGTSAYPGVPLHPIDARCGEKATNAASDRKVWRWLGDDRYYPLQIETTLSRLGKTRFKSGSWFWHEWDDSVATREQIQEWRATADTLRANLLLNAGPSPEGRLRPIDDITLRGLRA